MSKFGNILLIDDDPAVLEALRQTFIDDYEVMTAQSGEEGIASIQREGQRLDAVVLDIRMAKMDGLETATRIQAINPEIPIIFHTGYPGEYSQTEIDSKHQPYDYVSKSEHPARLLRSVRNAVSCHRLKYSSEDLIANAREQYGLVGKSTAMQEIYRTIEKIAPTDNKVVILGQTGTGKELIARAIHQRGTRADKRLAIFNCNHKAPDLVESELFGHLRGSFTGAVQDRIGMFEYADTGTLFLDEIGDLDITTQGKLLRVLETGEMHRLGSPEVIRVDVRLVCATNRDLVKLVAERKFREDLYYRLKGITITIPPLSERREDIPDLIDYFMEEYAQKKGDGLKVFERSARDLLLEFDWPGNVRQLLDTVQSIIDLSPSYFVSRDEVHKYLGQASEFSEQSDNGHNSLAKQVKDFKRLVLIRTLDSNGNNVSAAARSLNVDASNLRKLLKSLDVQIGRTTE
jgi:two-component system nitrogen regulation response regulator NtrX